MFPSPTGPISPDSVLHMLYRVLKRAELPQVRYHRGPAGGSQDHERGAGRCYADLNLYLGSRHRNLMS